MVVSNNLLDASYALQDQVLSSDRTRLVKTTDIDATSERDTEWFGTENGYETVELGCQ